MILLPAIDLIEGKAVRLYKGDYEKMTVYSDRPEDVALDFISCGAEWVHLVDLEGAKTGQTPNLKTIKKIIEIPGLKAEAGGGIRNMETVERYLDAGISRVILGTAAVKDPVFLLAALERYGEKIAVGVDLKDGFVAVRGWTEKSEFTGLRFLKQMEDLGVQTVIVTDISKDGAMKGTNHKLYRELSETLHMNIIASGGVSSLDDVEALKETGLYGAIIGKAYYTGAIDLRKALKISHGKDEKYKEKEGDSKEAEEENA